MKPVCLVMGAGAGIGGTVGKRFAQEGYHAVLCRRTDQEGLNTLVADIEGAGGTATGHLLNAIDPDGIEQRVAAIEADIGAIEVVVFNLGAQIGNRPLADTSYKAFELGWRMATFALFRLPPSARSWRRGAAAPYWSPPPRRPCAATPASTPMPPPWAAAACCASP